MSKVIWNEQTCFMAARTCNSRSDFSKRYRGAYAVAKANNWLDTYIWFTDPKENTNWGTGHQRGVDKKKVPVLKTKGKEVIGFYSSAADAQKEGGFDRRKISDVCNGRKQSHKGFGWEFADFGFLFWYYKKKVLSLWPRPKL